MARETAKMESDLRELCAFRAALWGWSVCALAWGLLDLSEGFDSWGWYIALAVCLALTNLLALRGPIRNLRAELRVAAREEREEPVGLAA